MQDSALNTQFVPEKKPAFSYSLATIILIAVFCVVFSDFWKNWKKEHTPFVWDVKQYYAYLPATFIQKDLTFKTTTDLYLNVLPDGTRIPRATYGMSLMYLPTFALGYKIALNSKEPITDGHSEGFITAIHYGVMFYFICALFFLRAVLLRYFKENVVAFTLLIIFFGTNLFFYVLGEGEMPHSYLFFLFSAFIWLTIKWHESQKLKHAIFLGIILGIVVLIRPTEILLGTFFLLYGVKNKNDLLSTFHLFKRNWKSILAMGVAFFIMLLPQLIYWKIMSGQFFFFSYGNEERFFWGDPKILNVLLGYRKGWLLYTPLMIMALGGLFIVKRYVPKFSHLIGIYVAINIYLISSWWCWWFGGSFGMRAMVQSYVFLSLPLACVVDRIFNGETFGKPLYKFAKYLGFTFIIFCVYLNLLQTYQFEKGMLHYCAMTKKAYWIVFGKFEWQGDDEGKYWSSLEDPQPEKAIKGIR